MSKSGWEWKGRVPFCHVLSNAPCDNAPHTTCAGQDEGWRGQKKRVISRDAEDMLIAAWRRPRTLTELYKELGFGGSKAARCKKELIHSMMAMEVELPTKRRGRKKKMLQASERGERYLKELGVRGRDGGRGGARHLYYQRKLKEFYEERNYVVEVEAKVGDTYLDVLVITDAYRLGIEIACSEQYEHVNVMKALEAGIERLLVVCETEELKQRLERKITPLLEERPGPRPGFKLVSDYLEDD